MLRNALEGEYRIDARDNTIDRHTLSATKLLLTNVTARVGVTSYKYSKLKEVLERYPDNTAIAEVSAVIAHALDEVLDKGQREGGNVIISWDPEIWDHRRWTPPSTT